ncbi:MAG: VOC family protein [Rhodospirillaceae bacterium]|nr:VOC family protein [Rhodospirillaceae bacterium]
MALRTLDHCSIRTLNLEASRAFYVEVLGMKEGDRPDFAFPGAWLYLENRSVIHLVGVDPDDSRGLEEYLGGEIDPDTLLGGGSLDHIAFCATNAPDMIRRLKGNNVPFRERQVPNMDLNQIFVEDPNGITIELNYFGS